LLIGSGITAETLETFLPITDGFIVGTYFKVHGQVENPVDLARVRELVSVKKAFRAV
jgi:predicted TIM-barrel enzyme